MHIALVTASYLCVSLSYVSASNATTSEPRDTDHKATWIARPLTDALWGFAPNSTTNTLCQAQSRLYVEHLRKGTLWAVEMLESSALAPHGVLYGNTYQLGQFDECIGLYVPTHKLRGKYCLPTIHFAPVREAYPDYYQDTFHSDPYSLYYPPELPAWNKIKVTPDRSKIHKNEIQWALCVPDACTTEDVRLSLITTLSSTFKYYGINGSVELDNEMCYVEQPFSLGFKILSSFLGLTFFFVVAATCYDMLLFRNSEAAKLSKGKFVKVVLSYSVYRNLLKLKKADSSSELAVMHGMRTYSMCLIILGHRFMFSYGGPLNNPQYVESRYRHFEDAFLLNGTIIVDTFFILSGFLTCYMTYKDLEKQGRLRFVAMYLYRWLRITPTYMIMIAFYALILPQLGDGPFWQARAGLEAERCQKNWWANLLFINNYVNNDNLCMFQSWFITCDMHYFLIAPFIVYMLWKYPKTAKAILFLLLCLAIVIPSLITYYNGYDGVLKVYMSLLKDPTKNEHYYNFYIKSHNRAIPYILGIASAYLYFHLKAIKYRVSGLHVRIGSVVGTISAVAALCMAFVFYIPGSSISPIFHALYASIHRVFWTLPMCWLIIVGGIKGFGILDKILSLRALVPFSRLTYCAFLVHSFVQVYTIANLRNPQDISHPRLFLMAFGDIGASFIFALVLHLLFEAPIASVQRMIMRPNKPHEHKPKKVKPETNPAFVAESQPPSLNLNNLDLSPDKLPNIDTYIERERL